MDAPKYRRLAVDVEGVVELEAVREHIDLVLNGSEPPPLAGCELRELERQRVDICNDDDVQHSGLLSREA